MDIKEPCGYLTGAVVSGLILAFVRYRDIDRRNTINKTEHDCHVDNEALRLIYSPIYLSKCIPPF